MHNRKNLLQVKLGLAYDIREVNLKQFVWLQVENYVKPKNGWFCNQRFTAAALS